MTTSYFRGHAVYIEKDECFYSDTRTPTFGSTTRVCGFCGRDRTKEGHDGCLGVLPGPVDNACCGHGQDDEAYIQFENGNIVQGEKALRMIRELRASPAKGT
jgi:hypothetical protein